MTGIESTLEYARAYLARVDAKESPAEFAVARAHIEALAVHIETVEAHNAEMALRLTELQEANGRLVEARRAATKLAYSLLASLIRLGQRHLEDEAGR